MCFLTVNRPDPQRMQQRYNAVCFTVLISVNPGRSSEHQLHDHNWNSRRVNVSLCYLFYSNHHCVRFVAGEWRFLSSSAVLWPLAIPLSSQCHSPFFFFLIYAKSAVPSLQPDWCPLILPDVVSDHDWCGVPPP